MKDNRDNKNTIQALITEEDKSLVSRAAHSVAAKYCKPEQRYNEQKELYHYGIIGLLQAKKKFDSSKNIPFAAFAVQRIRGEMISYLRVSPLVHQPQLVRKSVKEVQQARHDLESVGRSATTKDIAAKLGWKQGKVQKVASIKTDVISISAGRQIGEDDNCDGDRDFATREMGPEKTAMRKELAELFTRCLEEISKSRDRLILLARLLHDKTLQELADNFDCTAESIRQYQKKAMDSMRSCFEKNGWDKYSINELEPAMGKDGIIMRAMEIWQDQTGAPVTGSAGEQHLGTETLYRLAQSAGLQTASEEELTHLSLCPICLASWSDWQETLTITNDSESTANMVMTYGLLKAASTDLQEPLRLESACGQFCLTLFSDTSAPGHALITLEVQELAENVMVEGQFFEVRDAGGALIVSGTMHDGRLAGRTTNINTFKLDSWTIVMIPVKSDIEE